MEQDGLVLSYFEPCLALHKAGNVGRQQQHSDFSSKRLLFVMLMNTLYNSNRHWITIKTIIHHNTPNQITHSFAQCPGTISKVTQVLDAPMRLP